MRVSLEPIFDGSVQVIINPAEDGLTPSKDQKLFVDLLIPHSRRVKLSSGVSPYPYFQSADFEIPPVAAELETESGWLTTYDCTDTITAEYRVIFPGCNKWAIIQFELLRITVKTQDSVVVFKIPPPPGVKVDPVTHQVQV